MATSLKNKMKSLSKERQQKIQARASELAALEMTLQELRKNKEITQEQLAEILEIGQDSVSRLESRSDIKLSSLQSYVKALGGNLRIVADFPNDTTVEVLGIGEND